ncbi:MAG: hypothetical protein NZ455_11255 [Bacteroidia bacterium]|nr:hypothetical protein [Bacteroidia bacterium]
MALSLIDVEKRNSYSIGQEQIIVSQADKIKFRKKKQSLTTFTQTLKSYLLNVVVIKSVYHKGRTQIAILFSTDLSLWLRISLRFTF